MSLSRRVIVSLFAILGAFLALNSGGDLPANNNSEQALERAVRGVLTDEQRQAFADGADPASLKLDSGGTLADFIGQVASKGLVVEGLAYFPLSRCIVLQTWSSTDGQMIANEKRDFVIRGEATDLSDQGGSATGCDVPVVAEALAVDFRVSDFGNDTGQLRAYASDQPANYPIIHYEADSEEIYHNSTILDLCLEASCPSDFRVWTKNAGAHVRMDLLGYFAPVGSGPSGPSGPTGPMGPSGPSGPSGPTGPSSDHAVGTQGTAVGTDALASLTSGAANTAVGYEALYSNTTGFANVAVGSRALYSNTAGFYNVAVGSEALSSNEDGSGNIAVGVGSLVNNTDGGGNVAVGFFTMVDNTSGYFNVAVGLQALSSNTTGDGNIALGLVALFENTVGYDNIALGTAALFNNTDGFDNVAVGYEALYKNDGGYENIAVGDRALRSNTGGDNNTALGDKALYYNTGGDDNIGVGNEALYYNTTGNDNIALGNKALYYSTTADANIAIGDNAMYYNTSGYENVAVGRKALYDNTTGHNNVALGGGALYDNTTGNGNIALGFGAGASATIGSDNIFIGNAGVAGDASLIKIGTAGTHTATYVAGIRSVTTGVADAVTVYVDSAGQLGTMSSSERFKEDVQDMGEISSALIDLRPVTFRFKERKAKGEQRLEYGLIAEEVAKAFPALVVFDSDGKPLTVRYHLLSSLLLNEFQRLHSRLAAVEEREGALLARLERLEAQAQRPNLVAGRDSQKEPVAAQAARR